MSVRTHTAVFIMKTNLSKKTDNLRKAACDFHGLLYYDTYGIH